MKTQSENKTIRSFLIIFVVAVSFLNVGCPELFGGKKKKNNTVATAPPPVNDRNYCVGCEGYTDIISSAANASIDNGVDLAMNIYAPTAVGVGYSGPVDINGYMEVFNTVINECPFVPGYYRLRVNGPSGHYGPNASTTFNMTNVNLEAIHDDGRIVQLYAPYLEIQDAQAIEGADGRIYQNIFWGEIHVLSVDGIQCGIWGTPRKLFFPLQ